MGSRIVVIESNHDLREMLVDLLESHGYDVTAIGHPHFAHTLDPAHQPDLFMIDVQLAGLSRHTVAEQLHEEGYGTTPVIATSAHTLALDAGLDDGAFQATLPEPFTPDDVLASVQETQFG